MKHIIHIIVTWRPYIKRRGHCHTCCSRATGQVFFIGFFDHHYAYSSTFCSTFSQDSLTSHYAYSSTCRAITISASEFSNNFILIKPKVKLADSLSCRCFRLSKPPKRKKKVHTTTANFHEHNSTTSSQQFHQTLGKPGLG